ncbi:hypothetical protein [Adhaeribacter aquaticus]|uniref:hypothetical protein n=1 Tax=Adhaeribacter aquaticus TaxID=299567 RepID=UPI0003FD0674|nr:hypothetical protein [Adhaeribacter aquaticus]
MNTTIKYELPTWRAQVSLPGNLNSMTFFNAQSQLSHQPEWSASVLTFSDSLAR